MLQCRSRAYSSNSSAQGMRMDGHMRRQIRGSKEAYGGNSQLEARVQISCGGTQGVERVYSLD